MQKFDDNDDHDLDYVLLFYKDWPDSGTGSEPILRRYDDNEEDESDDIIEGPLGESSPGDEDEDLVFNSNPSSNNEGSATEIGFTTELVCDSDDEDLTYRNHKLVDATEPPQLLIFGKSLPEGNSNLSDVLNFDVPNLPSTESQIQSLQKSHCESSAASLDEFLAKSQNESPAPLLAGSANTETDAESSDENDPNRTESDTEEKREQCARQSKIAARVKIQNITKSNGKKRDAGGSDFFKGTAKKSKSDPSQEQFSTRIVLLK